MSLADRWTRTLTELQSQGCYRQLIAPTGVDLCSNDYLGLSTDPRLRLAVTHALDQEDAICSTGSRLLSDPVGPGYTCENP